MAGTATCHARAVAGILRMGLTSRGGAAFVWCPHCGTEGPHVAFSVPGPETDRKAFDGWNGMDRMARL